MWGVRGQQHSEQASGLPAASSGAQKKDKEMRKGFAITRSRQASVPPTQGQVSSGGKLARSHLGAPRDAPGDPGTELL